MLQYKSNAFIFDSLADFDVQAQIKDIFDKGIKKCKTCTFVQCFWCPIGVLIFMQGGKEFFKDDANSNAIWNFIKELDR